MIDYFDTVLLPTEFGVSDDLQTPKTDSCWAWTPIHAAVLKRNDIALRVILESGANANTPCSGLCDCAAPCLRQEDDPNESVAPHTSRTVWSPLHIAICTGNVEAMRLLVDASASDLVGAMVKSPRALIKTRFNITSLQSAAWLGSTEMCAALLHVRSFDEGLGWSALHYAAAGGHMESVGKILSEHSVTARYTPVLHRVYRVVVQLFMQHQYEHAETLLKACIAEYKSCTELTSILRALCLLREPVMYNKTKLRARQDCLHRPYQHSSNHVAIDDTKAIRLQLAI